jgi:hypothetical protein
MMPKFKAALACEAAVGGDGIVVNPEVYGMVRSASRPGRSRRHALPDLLGGGSNNVLLAFSLDGR